MNAFIIDAPIQSHLGSRDVLIAKLNALPNTQARDGGAYREDPRLCQVLVQTPMTERELDHWLWATPGVDYFGASQFSGSAF